MYLLNAKMKMWPSAHKKASAANIQLATCFCGAFFRHTVPGRCKDEAKGELAKTSRYSVPNLK